MKKNKVNNKKVISTKNSISIIFIKLFFLEHQDNSELAEIRKLIQTYVKEEILKIQNTTEEQELLRPPQVEKHRSIKSGSTKTSKPQTPK
jgi:hypothetical protein